MNFLRKQKEITSDYFENTPLFIIIFDFAEFISFVLCAIIWIVSKQPYFLCACLAIIILALSTVIYRIKVSSVRIKDLYFGEETFLLKTISNIVEIDRLKKKFDINDILVEEFDMHYNVGPSYNQGGLQQSDLDVNWTVRGFNHNGDLCKYHLLYSKSETRRSVLPTAAITELDGTYDASLTDNSNGLYNHFHASFENGSLPKDSRFIIKFDLKSYYRFVWSDCEILLINAGAFGNRIKKTKATLTFTNSEIEGKNISVYKIDRRNFRRKLVQESPCIKRNDGTYEYCFEHNGDSSNYFFFIKMPPSLS